MEAEFTKSPRFTLFLSEKEFDKKCLTETANQFENALFGFPVEKIIKRIKGTIDNDDGFTTAHIAFLESKRTILSDALQNNRTTDCIELDWWLTCYGLFEHKSSIAAVTRLIELHDTPLCGELNNILSRWEDIFMEWKDNDNPKMIYFLDYCEKNQIIVHPSRFKLSKKKHF